MDIRNYRRGLIAAHWQAFNMGLLAEARDIAEALADTGYREVIIDGSLPAPDVLPNNVVPFTRCSP